jgi:SagB-type dehydrogenase family enzyme
MRRLGKTFFLLLIILQTIFSAIRAQEVREEVLLPWSLPERNVSIKDAISEIGIYPEREFSFRPIGLEELGQLLWSAYNVRLEEVICCTPSHVFLSTTSIVEVTPSPYCPLELYVILSSGVSLLQGVYKYNSQKYSLELLKAGSYESELVDIVGEKFNSLFSSASAFIVFASVPENVRRKYGIRGEVKYTPLFIGKAIQNLYFQAYALSLYTYPIVKFDEEKVVPLLNLPERELPYCIAPIVPLKIKEEKKEKEEGMMKLKTTDKNKKVKDRKIRK